MSFTKHHSSLRGRKNWTRPAVKHVKIVRGHSGYGLTILSQKPCILNFIIAGSPADLAGLKAGDVLLGLNGKDVSHALHDEVVRMVGESSFELYIQVAETVNSLDFSGHQVTQTSHHNTNRKENWESQGISIERWKMETGLLPLNSGNFSLDEGKNDSQSETLKKLKDCVYSYGQSFRKVNHPEQLKHQLVCHAGQMFANNCNKSIDFVCESSATVSTSAHTMSFVSLSNSHTSPLTKAMSFQQNENISEEDSRPFSEYHLKNTNVSVHPGEKKYETMTAVDKFESTQLNSEKIRVIVAYIGSIKLQDRISHRDQFLPQVKNTVRHLCVEAKIQTLVLMEVDTSGVQWTSEAGGSVIHYSADSVAFIAVYPDDMRFFGIITINGCGDDLIKTSSCVDKFPKSSCHVFMVDPARSPHSHHIHEAKAFNFQCTPCLKRHPCQEFPLSPFQLVLWVSHLYQIYPESEVHSDVIQSRISSETQAWQQCSNNGFRLSHKDHPKEKTCLNRQQKKIEQNNVFLGNGNGLTRTSSISMKFYNEGFMLHQLSNEYQRNKAVKYLQRPLSNLEIHSSSKILSSSSSISEGHKNRQRFVDENTASSLPDMTSCHSPQTDTFAKDMRQSVHSLLQAQQQELKQRQTGNSDCDSRKSSKAGSCDFVSTRVALAKHQHRPLSPSASQGSGYASEQSLIVDGREKSGGSMLLGTANSDSSIGCLKPEVMEKVGHVAGWAVSFSGLLADPAGLCAFTEFVKLEHSEENIHFWSEVEAFKQLTDTHLMQSMALNIFKKYLSLEACEAVNVDSAAQRMTEQLLDTPSLSMFDIAQQQVYELMKTDSYRRFLKSDLYKGILLQEMKDQAPLTSMLSARQSCLMLKKKRKEKEDQEKRKSFLSWKQIKRSSMKKWRKVCEKEGIAKETTREGNRGNCSEGDAEHPRLGLNIPEDSSFSDENRKEDLLVPEDKDACMEHLVLFRLELPDHKSIGIKAQSHCSVKHVLKPILQKYGYQLDSCRACLSKSFHCLDLDKPASDLESQHVVIVTDPDSAGHTREEKNTVFKCAGSKKWKKTENPTTGLFCLAAH